MAASVKRCIAVLLVPLLLLTSCAPVVHELNRELIPPPHAAQVDARAPYLLAHMRDGRVVVFDTWTIVDSTGTVAGSGRVLGQDRATISEGLVSVRVDDVALFETNDEGVLASSVAKSVVVTLLGLAGTALLGLAFAHALHSLFGSCPTFYAWDGQQMRLQGEAFSTSIAPGLEATDVDALARAVPRRRTLEIEMRNEALETHVVRHAHVLAVPRPEGGRAFASTEGGFRAAGRTIPPDRAIAPEGDVTAMLAEFDGRERASRADSTDLGTRETVDLVFDAPPVGDLGLVLASRQSLLASYLFYEALASLGPEAPAWIASLARGTPGALAQAAGIGGVLGGIEVQIRDGAGGWRTVAEVRETGPLATDQRVVPLPGTGPGVPGVPFEVRLRMAKGAWRLNQVALTALGDAVRPIRLVPQAALTEGRADDEARARLSDTTRVLVTLPGQTWTLRYRLPEHPERYELFLESRGYYLEWIREQWLSTADPARAALMASRPREALRVLAPEYARAEKGFEAAFWGNHDAGP
jgi:hypothetical protein